MLPVNITQICLLPPVPPPLLSHAITSPPLIYSPQFVYFSPSISPFITSNPLISQSLTSSVFLSNINTQSALHNSILLPRSTQFHSSLLLSCWKAASTRSAPYHFCLLFLLYSHHHLLSLFSLCFIDFFIYPHMKQKELEWMGYNESKIYLILTDV